MSSGGERRGPNGSAFSGAAPFGEPRMGGHTEVHPEETSLGIGTNGDLKKLFRDTFPDKVAFPRVRVSPRVQDFLKRSRPQGLSVSGRDAYWRLSEGRGFAQKPERGYSGGVIVISSNEEGKDASVSVPQSEGLVIGYVAELAPSREGLVFSPRLKNMRGTSSKTEEEGKEIEEAVCGAFGFGEVTVSFTEKARIEKLKAVEGAAPGEIRRVSDSQDVVRISFESEDPAPEVSGATLPPVMPKSEPVKRRRLSW